MLISHKPLPTKSFLDARYKYCPNTGVITYIKNIKQCKVGEKVGCISDVGYFASVEAADKAIQEIRLNLHKEFCNHG